MVHLPKTLTNPTIVKVIYLLTSNYNFPGGPDIFIPHEMFREILESFDSDRNIYVYVHRARPWLKKNGFYVKGVSGGYRVFKNMEIIIEHGKPKHISVFHHMDDRIFEK